MTDFESLIVESPQGASLIACAGFLYDHMPLAERGRLATELIRLSAAKKSVVVCAREHDRLVAAVTAQIMLGKQAFVQSPKIVDASEKTLPQLWSKLESLLQARGVDYVQAILPPDIDSSPLERVGLATIARLSFLSVRVVDSTPPETDLQFETYRESEAARLRDLVERTYVDSADCPAVEGMRSLDDVLDGYRGAGNYDPSNWFFVTRDNEDVGCLLLADHPANQQFELVYMGLVAPARGQGLGATLAEMAKAKTAAAGRNQIFVSVDTQNQPALQAYTRCGFRTIQEQHVLAKKLATIE